MCGGISSVEAADHLASERREAAENAVALQAQELDNEYKKYFKIKKSKKNKINFAQVAQGTQLLTVLVVEQVRVLKDVLRRCM